MYWIATNVRQKSTKAVAVYW